MHNFSSKQLTKAESEIIAKDLHLCFYPHRLNLSNIKVQFKKTHNEMKTHLAQKDILDLKFTTLASVRF